MSGNTFCNICGKYKLSADLPVSIELWKTCNCEPTFSNRSSIIAAKIQNCAFGKHLETGAAITTFWQRIAAQQLSPMTTAETHLIGKGNAMTEENKPNPVAPESYKPAEEVMPTATEDDNRSHIRRSAKEASLKTPGLAATPVTVEAPRLKQFTSEIADKLAELGFHRDCGNNNRLVIEHELETMEEVIALASAAPPKPIGDVEAVARKIYEASPVINGEVRPSFDEIIRILIPFFARISDKTLNAIVQDVAELPDRTSPDDWPEAMLVTAEELKAIISGNIEESAQPPCSECATLEKVLDLVATDELFIQPADGGGWVFWVNVNDMFYPAADGEGIDLSEIPAVWNAWKEKGWPGVVRWVQEKRSGLELRKSREETILNIENMRIRAEKAELECATLQGKLSAVVIMLRARCSDKEWDAMPETLSEVLPAEITTLRKERDDYRHKWNDVLIHEDAALKSCRSLTAQLSTLRDALKDLLEWMPTYSKGSSDYMRVEKVRAALAPTPEVAPKE